MIEVIKLCLEQRLVVGVIFKVGQWYIYIGCWILTTFSSSSTGDIPFQRFGTSVISIMSAALNVECLIQIKYTGTQA